MNTIDRKLYKILLVMLSVFLSLSLTVFSPFKQKAEATINSNDKIYGETLSQRGMSVKDCPSISAQYACIMSKEGDMIYERNAYAPAKIASLTKIMTAIIAIENSNLSDEIVIDEKAVKVGESSAGFWVGDKLDMQSTLYALMVPSGNDAAEAICENVGKKLIDSKDDRIRLKSAQEVADEAKENEISEDDVKDVYITDSDKAFCKLMNDKAAELGCTNTCFTNPHGLDNDEYASDDQKCCAFDIAQITKYAMTIDLFRTIVGGGDKIINVSRGGNVIPLRLNSTDLLLSTFEGCIGVKTGNTDLAGACFSGACQDNDNHTEFYSIVLKCDNEAQRFVDTQDLFNWYLTNKVNFKPADTNVKETMQVNGETKEVGVVAYIAQNDWIDSRVALTTEDQNLSVGILAIAGNVHLKLEPETISGNIKAGDKVCELVLTQHNNQVSRINLIAINDNPAPNVFQMLGVGFDRIIRSISGQNTVAKTEIITNCDKINEVTNNKS